jgi:hypothetical protein
MIVIFNDLVPATNLYAFSYQQKIFILSEASCESLRTRVGRGFYAIHCLQFFAAVYTVSSKSLDHSGFYHYALKFAPGKGLREYTTV